jgi:hypothetical protein
MRLQLVVIVLVAFGLNACTQRSQKNEAVAATKDTLNYTYKTINRRVAGCGSKPDSSCIVADIKYPVFVNQKVLNDMITYHLLNIFEFSERKITSLDELAESFVKYWQGYKDSIYDGMPYKFNLFAKVRCQDSSLEVLEFGVYLYRGGAPNYQTDFINWNSKAGREITMNDIFNNGYNEPLNKIAEKIFRKDEKLTDTASLANAYTFYKNKFGLNENFMITSTGILFLYNLYEIKPRSKSQTTLFIPYTQIKKLLRPNTVIAQYIK